MWDFHRTLKVDELPDGDTVFCVQISNAKDMDKWWLIAHAAEVDLCTEDPGHNVDLYIAGKLENLAAVWMGDVTLQKAVAEGVINLTGEPHLEKSAHRWFPRTIYADE
jgi:hypothetical protein